VRNVGRRVEQLIDAMTTVSLDDGAIAALGVLLNHIPGISKEHARFDYADGIFKTFSCSLNHAHRVCIRSRFVSHVVGFVQVPMKAFVVQRHVEVEDVTVKENSLIRYAVTNDFIG